MNIPVSSKYACGWAISPTLYPFIWLFVHYVEVHHPSAEHMAWIILIGSLLLLILDTFIGKYIDLPI